VTSTRRSSSTARALVLVAAIGGAVPAGGQTPAPKAPARPAAQAPAPPAAPPAVQTPPDYLIGPDDILAIVFWREKDMSGEVTVRPDGRIALPLINDVQAAGLTPDQLRVALNAAAAKYVEDPAVTVLVKQINSRRVFITGQVAKPGAYPLTTPITVVQLITIAGGVLEYADTKNISVMRTENGKTTSFRFNFKDVMQRKNLRQNIELKPGDTIVVP